MEAVSCKLHQQAGGTECLGFEGNQDTLDVVWGLFVESALFAPLPRPNGGFAGDYNMLAELADVKQEMHA